MGLFSSVKKAVGGALSGGLKSAVGAFAGAGAQYGANQIFPQDTNTQRVYEEHLKRGVRWRVRDAKAAGVHPLFALGASIGQGVPLSSQNFGGAPGVAGDVSSGVQRGFSAPQRAAAVAQGNEAHRMSMEVDAARAAALRAQAHRDFIASQAELSRTRRELQRANVVQDTVNKRGETTLPGLGLKIPEGSSTSAQEFEDRYGDAASWVYGIGRLGVDSYKAARGAVKKKGTWTVPRGRKTSRDPFAGYDLY